MSLGRIFQGKKFRLAPSEHASPGCPILEVQPCTLNPQPTLQTPSPT